MKRKKKRKREEKKATNWSMYLFHVFFFFLYCYFSIIWYINFFLLRFYFCFIPSSSSSVHLKAALFTYTRLFFILSICFILLRSNWKFRDTECEQTKSLLSWDVGSEAYNPIDQHLFYLSSVVCVQSWLIGTQFTAWTHVLNDFLHSTWLKMEDDANKGQTKYPQCPQITHILLVFVFGREQMNFILKY